MLISLTRQDRVERLGSPPAHDLLLLHGKISSFNGGYRDGTTTKAQPLDLRSVQLKKFRMLQTRKIGSKSSRTTGHGGSLSGSPVSRSPTQSIFFLLLWGWIRTLEWPFEVHPLAGGCWLIAMATRLSGHATEPSAGLNLGNNACPPSSTSTSPTLTHS